MNQLDAYLSGFSESYSAFDQSAALSVYKPRDPFAHKGNFGHALLLAGSYGKIGAAVLAARACLASGAGLLTTYLPACGYAIMQTALPEAMVRIDEDEFQLTGFPTKLDAYHTAGLGPGIGTSEETASMLSNFIRTFSNPLVLDADALNIIAESREILSALNPDTILTPHLREFDRLFGESKGDQARFEKARKMALKYKIIIVLKGHFTGIFHPDGKITFNINGNAGMAKGGSGDALTGIITALLSQSYKPGDAASLGVYLHGHAGDLASGGCSEEAMLPSDLIQNLGQTFLKLKAAFHAK